MHTFYTSIIDVYAPVNPLRSWYLAVYIGRRLIAVVVGGWFQMEYRLQQLNHQEAETKQENEKLQKVEKV